MFYERRDNCFRFQMFIGQIWKCTLWEDICRKKILFFWALPKSPLPHPPTMGTLVFFSNIKNYFLARSTNLLVQKMILVVKMKMVIVYMFVWGQDLRTFEKNKHFKEMSDKIITICLEWEALNRTSMVFVPQQQCVANPMCSKSYV